MNFKKASIAILFFVLVMTLTVFSLKKITQNYQVIKIEEPSNAPVAINSIVSNKVKNYLKNKNIETNLPPEQLQELYWVERIKEGGLILLFRHSERAKWNDSVEGFDTYELKNKLDARNFSWKKATCLTEKGIEESKLVSESFKHAKIKIGKVISSPSCRARETALYAFGKIDEIYTGLLHYSAFHHLDKEKISIQLRKSILAEEISKGTNLILSAHNKVISHEGFIDTMLVDEGLNETGFYIIEKTNNQLVVPFKFKKIKNFIVLLYRHDFEKIIK
ncbi:histidine phosphatase family protein [Pelagibacteraceae bacterium]|nr:histidine phosphatase family protein [Pelagibacteraceae bacterium]